MSKDIHLAFAHPGERAADTWSGDDLPDRISLRDYIVEVEIGAFQAERGTTQRVQFNVVVEVGRSAAAADDVDKILSYDRVTEAIDAALAEERLNLLETLAERVAELILAEPQAQRVFVRIEKIDRGPYALGVEIVRSHGAEAGSGAPVLDAPAPLIVHLGNRAIAAPALKAFLDELGGDERPVILTVGAAEIAPPQSAGHMAQRRIDLLGIEQNAWVLAGRDNRCVVVGTRTELDWAMKNGQMCVWAPSKMVLDAVDGPSTVNDLDLIAWFAGDMQADALMVVDAPAPKVDCPVREVTLEDMA